MESDFQMGRAPMWKAIEICIAVQLLHGTVIIMNQN